MNWYKRAQYDSEINLDYVIGRLADYAEHGVGQVTHIIAEAQKVAKQPLPPNASIQDKQKHAIVSEAAKFQSFDDFQASAQKAQQMRLQLSNKLAYKLAGPYSENICPSCTRGLLVDFWHEKGAKYNSAPYAVGECPSCGASMKIQSVNSEEMIGFNHSAATEISREELVKALKNGIPAVLVVQTEDAATYASIGDRWYDRVKPVDSSPQVEERPHMPLQYGSPASSRNDPQIICHKCSWQWKLSETQPHDRYVCHKCNYDNTRHYRGNEDGKGALLDVTAERLPLEK